MVNVQMELYRSCVLMKHVDIPLNNWAEKLENNHVLRIIAGFTKYNMPKIPTPILSKNKIEIRSSSVKAIFDDFVFRHCLKNERAA